MTQSPTDLFPQRYVSLSLTCLDSSNAPIPSATVSSPLFDTVTADAATGVATVPSSENFVLGDVVVFTCEADGFATSSNNVFVIDASPMVSRATMLDADAVVVVSVGCSWLNFIDFAKDNLLYL